MMPPRARRVLAVAACAGLAFAVQGSVGNSAVALDQPFQGNGISITISGGPVFLKGDNGVDCSDTNAEDYDADAPAELSGPLTLTVKDLPAGSPTFTVEVGDDQGFEAKGVSRTTSTVVIPVTGGFMVGAGPLSTAAQFTCGDAAYEDGHTINFSIQAAVPGLASIGLADRYAITAVD